jgi:excisionase family DNA binding protein
MVPPVATSFDARPWWQRPVVPFEIYEAFAPTMARIDVKNNNSALRAGTDADVGIRVFMPPRVNLLSVERGVFEPVLSLGVLSGVVASGIPAGTLSVAVNRIEREDKPPALCARKSPTLHAAACANEFSLTVRQAAQFLGVSPQTVYLWVERKQIPHLRVMGRNIRFLRSDLEPFRASFKQEMENNE